MIEWIDVEPKNVRACDTKEKLNSYILDVLAAPPQAEDIITIRPGYWYGTDVHFFLFDKRQTQPEPECFEVEVWVRESDGRIAAKLPIRVVRTENTSAPKDGGTEAPKPPATDAGAP